MLTRRENSLSGLMIVVQVVLSLLVFFVTEFYYPAPHVQWYENLFFLSQIAIIWGFLFTKFHLGIIFRHTSYISMIRGYLVTISIAGILLLLELRLLILFGHYSYSAYYILLFCVIDFVVLVLFKLLFYKVMRYLRKLGKNIRNIIIVADDSSKDFVLDFIKSKDWGYSIKAILTPDQSLHADIERSSLVVSQSDVIDHFKLQGIDDIFYCLRVNDDRFDVNNLVTEAEELGITVHLLREDYAVSVKQDGWPGHNKPNAFVTYQKTSGRYISLKIKELIDIFLSSVILVLVGPVIVLIALLIKLEDRGPVFFRQERVGQNGRRFTCFKFRSMVPNAEKLLDTLKDKNESDGPTFKIEKDPRITRVGAFLRKTSLDELPQFYNVVRGEMSIVGPRPPLLKEVMQYEKYQLRRLSMKPGITCIWQVSGRNSIKFEQWMKMDLDYIDNWSLWLDFKIILKTVGVVFRANGQ